MAKTKDIPLDHIYVDRSVIKTKYFERIQNNIKRRTEYKHTTFTVIENHQDFIKQTAVHMDWATGKRNILVYPEKGKFLHACPGSDGVLCCRYYVVDFGMNCPYDCDYCYLQTYLTNPMITLAGNFDELLASLVLELKQFKNTPIRVGTGEYTDSLAMDHITEIAQNFVVAFNEIPHATLELKTKSTNIESLLKVETGGNTVISWSLNPDSIISNVEHGCPSLDERLQAAQTVIHAGYQVAFHFDPVVYYENWRDDYAEVVNKLFNTIPSNSIRWISLGTFRYTPGLKEKLRTRRPNEFITKAEMFPSKDGKMRYLMRNRVEIYKFLKDQILSFDPKMFVYLCMEHRNAWKSAFQYQPQGPWTLDRQFEKRRLDISK